MSGMNEGWVKFYRKLLGSAIWQNHNLTRFWTWCLLKATHETITVPIKHTKVALEPGQFIFTRPMACTETGLSEKTVRLCVETLRAGDSAEIGLTKGHNFSVVTVLKWRDYQIQDAIGAGKRAGKGPAKGRPINKEDKKKRSNEGKIAPVDVTWTGEKLMVPAVLMEKYVAKYPRLDIDSIIIDAERWLLKNPAKAAGYKSLDAFLNNWLRREEENRRKRDGDDSDYELTGDSLAAAIECANLFGRSANE